MIEFFDIEKPPPLAYTVNEAVRLVDANREARSTGPLKIFHPCWWPNVSWRMTRGGCYSPDVNDKSYVLGQFRFAYPYSRPHLRRKLARKNGRRRAQRVPLMDWFWWLSEVPKRSDGGYEFTPLVRASEKLRKRSPA